MINRDLLETGRADEQTGRNDRQKNRQNGERKERQSHRRTDPVFTGRGYSV